jgi:hypothetical protein
MTGDSGHGRGRVVAILTAMQLEANAVAAALGMARPHSGRPSAGAMGNLRITLHLIGIGARGLNDVSFDPDPRCVIMVGVAGALDPALKVGDIVIGGDPIGAGHWKRAAIHTTTEMVSRADAKAELFASTGAAAVDMETGIVERWAREHGVAFIAIRAISDSATQDLDPRVLSLVDRWGRPRFGAVAGMLVRRPWLGPSLRRLGRDSKLAGRRLGQAVRGVLQQLAQVESNNA